MAIKTAVTVIGIYLGAIVGAGIMFVFCNLLPVEAVVTHTNSPVTDVTVSQPTPAVIVTMDDPLVVGQIWERDKSNPFEDVLHYQKVIEIKGGWVKYEFWRSTRPHSKVISECRESAFRYKNTLQKD